LRELEGGLLGRGAFWSRRFQRPDRGADIVPNLRRGHKAANARSCRQTGLRTAGRGLQAARRAARAMGAPAVDAIERNHRKWHGKQVKKGIKKANARKRAEKRAKKQLRKTTKEDIVKSMFTKKRD
jgi:hypothetical protein